LVWLGWRLRPSLTYPDGSVVHYTYTARNKVKEIKRGSSVLVTYTYDLAGNRLTKTLENGTIATSTYDDKGQLTLLAHEKSGATQAAFGYTYNSVGNFLLSKVRDAASGPQQRMPLRAKRGTSKVVNMQSVVRTESYSYDAIDQVTSVNYGNSRSESFLYDAMGNRTQSTDSAVGTTAYTTNALNQYTAFSGHPVAPTYDPNGNLTGANGSTFAYDARNRLTSATTPGNTLTATYDCQNRPISRTINGVTTYFIWDGWSLIEERNAAGTLTTTYVHGPVIDELLVKTTTSGSVYYHHDGLGNTIAITNGNADVLERYSYDVFGQVTIVDASTGNTIPQSAHGVRHFYTGHDFQAELGLYLTHYRAYDPRLGRWLSADPIGENGGWNLYGYVGNHNTMLTDPLGLRVG
jgi:RHS repeat-associated protein